MTATLELRGVRRAFRGDAGVTELDLDVVAGEVHALVGLNGAGKTTLMRLALGMLRPDGGTIRISGTEVHRASPAIWRSVGHLIEMPFAYPELTTVENLRLAARLRAVPRSEIAATVDRGVAALGLERYVRVPARRLSLGNRQRLGLAAAVQHEPRLVVLDEPTNALDPSGTILLRDELRRLAESGCAVLVSSHHLDEVARIAKRITVMNRGRIVGALPPDDTDLERAFFRMVHADDLARGAA